MQHMWQKSQPMMISALWTPPFILCREQCLQARPTSLWGAEQPYTLSGRRTRALQTSSPRQPYHQVGTASTACRCAGPCAHLNLRMPSRLQPAAELRF
jgi:hypothetical protein